MPPPSLTRFHCPSVWFIYSLLLLLLHYEEHVVELVVQVAWHPLPHTHPTSHFHFHFAIPSVHCHAPHSPSCIPLPTSLLSSRFVAQSSLHRLIKYHPHCWWSVIFIGEQEIECWTRLLTRYLLLFCTLLLLPLRLLLAFILIHIPLVCLVVVFYYDNCLPSARVTVRPWSHLRHLTMPLAVVERGSGLGRVE